MRIFAVLTLLAGLFAFVSTPADAADEAAKPTYSTSSTPIGQLLDDPAACAIVDKFLPGFSKEPQIDMARPSTLKGIQMYSPDTITDEVLAKMDAEFERLHAQAK